MIRDIRFEPSQVYGSMQRPFCGFFAFSHDENDTRAPCYETDDKSAEPRGLLHLKPERLSRQSRLQELKTVFVIICEFGVCKSRPLIRATWSRRPPNMRSIRNKLGKTGSGFLGFARN